MFAQKRDSQGSVVQPRTSSWARGVGQPSVGCGGVTRVELPPVVGKDGCRGVRIFIDLSNIIIGVQEYARFVDGPLAGIDVRVHFDQLLQLVKHGRRLSHALAVFGLRACYDRMSRHLNRLGVETVTLERDCRGREVGVDEAIQGRMLQLLEIDDPGVVCLLTGDGAGAQDGRGFIPVLTELAAAGWIVEVYSWSSTLSTYLADWASKYALLVLLDDHYDEITFLEGTRTVGSAPRRFGTRDRRGEPGRSRRSRRRVPAAEGSRGAVVQADANRQIRPKGDE